MACGVVLFSEGAEMDGDAVLEIGGVSGDVYCTGVDCDCSKVCNMIAIWQGTRDEARMGSRHRFDGRLCLKTLMTKKRGWRPSNI
jgi:hypothetical protein